MGNTAPLPAPPEQDWEVWPSVAIKVGDLLRQECQPGEEPYLEVDTNAAVSILRERAPEDSSPGIVRLEIAPGDSFQKVEKSGKGFFMGIAKRVTQKEHKTKLPHVAEVKLSLTDAQGSLVGPFTLQMTTTHELDHAARYSSPRAVKEQIRFRRAILAKYIGPVLAGEALFWAAPSEPLMLGGLLLTAGGGAYGIHGIKKMPMKISTDSPMERSAYGTVINSAFYPKVITHSGPADTSSLEENLRRLSPEFNFISRQNTNMGDETDAGDSLSRTAAN